MWQGWLASLAVLCATVLASSATGSRVLVILDEPMDPYASLLGNLGERGYEVTVRTSAAATKDDALFAYDERVYDHIALLVPALKSLKGGISPQALVRFAEDGGNLLVGLSPRVSEAWRDFAREFGVELAERGTMLVDHFGYDPATDRGDHTSVLVGGYRDYFSAGGIAAPDVFRPETREALATYPIVFRGAAHWVGPNPLAFPLLTPPSTAYESELPEKGRIAQLEPLHEAKSLLTGFRAQNPDAAASLATAVQLRTNSRVVFLGSLALLQDPLYTDTARPAQQAVVDEMIAWTFQERGVLRVVSTTHERVRANDQDVRPEYEEEVGVSTSMYRVKDDVFFSLQLASYENQWGPAPTDLDLQLAVTMLDPFITLPLKAHVDGNATRYQGTFRLPDRHGVFTLRVNWKRHGWTYVVTEDVVPVRPYNHDEYPRMLSSSWPYVSGALSTMLAFSVFAGLWCAMAPASVPT